MDADAVDALATVLGFGSLSRRDRWGIHTVTAGAAVVSTRPAVALDTEAQGATPAPGATMAPRPGPRGDAGGDGTPHLRARPD